MKHKTKNMSKTRKYIFIAFSPKLYLFRFYFFNSIFYVHYHLSVLLYAGQVKFQNFTNFENKFIKICRVLVQQKNILFLSV